MNILNYSFGDVALIIGIFIAVHIFFILLTMYVMSGQIANNARKYEIYDHERFDKEDLRNRRHLMIAIMIPGVQTLIVGVSLAAVLWAWSVVIIQLGPRLLRTQWNTIFHTRRCRE